MGSPRQACRETILPPPALFEHSYKAQAISATASKEPCLRQGSGEVTCNISVGKTVCPVVVCMCVLGGGG